MHGHIDWSLQFKSSTRASIALAYDILHSAKKEPAQIDDFTLTSNVDEAECERLSGELFNVISTTMKAEAPELLVGAGTVLTGRDADAALKAGAEFLVSPGMSPGLHPTG